MENKARSNPRHSRSVKISPLAKGEYRKDFINKCLLRVKKDREANFEKLRGRFRSDCGSYAREIVSDAMDTVPIDVDSMGGESSPSIAMKQLEMEGVDGLDTEFYIAVMDQVADELAIEYAEFVDEQNQLESGFDISIELPEEDTDELLLCPFCR